MIQVQDGASDKPYNMPPHEDATELQNTAMHSTAVYEAV
jgi:hypothetical protein